MALFRKGLQSQIIAAVIASLGAMTIGIVIGRRWTPDIIFTDYITEDANDSATLFLFLGAIVGALIGGISTNMYGHKYTMVISEVMVIVGWVLYTQLSNISFMIKIGDVLQGLGIGAISITIPAYVGEISQAHIRGSLGVLFYAFFVIGVLYIYALASLIENQRVSNVLCVIWPAIHMIGVMFFTPESPYVYLKKGKLEKANMSMTKLRDNDAIGQELSIIQAEIDQQTYQQDTFKKVLKDQANLKALTIVLYIFTVASLADIRFIMTEIINICEYCDHKQTLTLVFFAVQLMMTFLTMKIIDKIGRKLLLVISGISMSLCGIGFYGYFKFIDDSSISWLLITLVVIYIAAFSLGFGPVPWVLIGEIFPMKVKIFGPCLVTAIYWFIMLMLSSILYIDVKEVESTEIGNSFIKRVVWSVLSSFFVWYVVPETKKKSLIQVKTILVGEDDSFSANMV